MNINKVKINIFFPVQNNMIVKQFHILPLIATKWIMKIAPNFSINNN